MDSENLLERMADAKALLDGLIEIEKACIQATGAPDPFITKALEAAVELYVRLALMEAFPPVLVQDGAPKTFWHTTP